MPQQGDGQESRHPVSRNVHSRAGIVNISKPHGGQTRSFLVGVPSIRHRRALENDVEQGAAISNEEQNHHGPLSVDVELSVLRDPDEHEGNRELDRYDGCAVEDFEEEEVHQSEFLVLRVPWFLEMLGLGADTI